MHWALFLSRLGCQWQSVTNEEAQDRPMSAHVIYLSLQAAGDTMVSQVQAPVHDDSARSLHGVGPVRSVQLGVGAPPHTQLPVQPVEDTIELQATMASLQVNPIASQRQFAVVVHAPCASEAQERTLSLHTAGELLASHEQLPSHAAWFRDAHGSGEVLLSHEPLSLFQAQLPVHR